MNTDDLIRNYINIVSDILLDSNFLKQKDFIQHGTTSVYEHVIEVSFICYITNVNKKDIDIFSLVRGALLHDYFLYDWHDKKKQTNRKGLHGFTHPKTASKNAYLHYFINKKERNIIRSHMWPLTIFNIPLYKESWIVCLIDKKVSLRETFGKKSKYAIKIIDELNNLLVNNL